MDKEIYCLLAKLPLIHFSAKSVNSIKFLLSSLNCGANEATPCIEQFYLKISCTVLQNLPGIVNFVLDFKYELSWDWEGS